MIAPLAVLALGTGLARAVLSRFGLVRYWWVAIKLTITAGLTAVVFLVLEPGLAATAVAETLTDAQRTRVVLLPAVALALLIVNVVLGLSKPDCECEAAVADLPISVWMLLMAAVLGIPAMTGVVLYRGAVAAGLGRRAAVGVITGFAAGWGGWLLLTGYLAGAAVYSGRGGPWFLVAVAGALAALLIATRIPVITRILAAPGTPAWLVVPHTLRILGVVFLILMIQGHLPALFAIPAGLGDLAIGVAAPFLARRLARGASPHAALRFHLLGILDLVVAAGIAALVTTGLLAVTPSTDALRLLPLALVPTAAVPLAIALHIVSLHQLRSNALLEEVSR